MNQQQWIAWHTEHERQLAAPHGFLSVTSLNFLTGEPQRFPDAPGRWSTGPDGVVVDLAEGESLTIDGVAVTGRYVPFDSPRQVTVGAAVEGLEHVYESPGRVEFEIDGTALALTVFNGRTPGSLFALFTDETSGVTTYAANRSLAIEPPGPDGRVSLDFNRAVNLPCAYTAYATCPLPPAENRLPAAVEAGEKILYEQAAAVR